MLIFSNEGLGKQIAKVLRKCQLMSVYTEDNSFAVMLNIIENGNSC